LRRHPDPWWPLQTSKRWPLVPSDIFYPAQSVPRYYALLSAAPDAITHCGGIRSGGTV
jgi:hypothetical protein